ncbi:hypothetical protein [Salipiger mucosus]|nr:hypothetical protein [Salipiger mucosus]
MSAAPASSDQAEDVADCAAFWAGAAQVFERNPQLDISPDTTRALAQEFRDIAGAAGMSAQDIAGIEAKRTADYRLLHRRAMGSDAQSRDIVERKSGRCEGLLPAPGHP